MPTITQPYQTLLHTCEDGVATITLNRPAQRNALDMVMREELAHAVDAIRRDREVRVVILAVRAARSAPAATSAPWTPIRPPSMRANAWSGCCSPSRP